MYVVAVADRRSPRPRSWCHPDLSSVSILPLALRLLWERVRSGGKLAITTWRPRFFEPATSAFWDSIRNERPDLYKGFNPWDRICDPQSLTALFAEAGIANPAVAGESGRHSISSPDAWWAAVLGSGYRGTVDQLDATARERVRAANFEFISNSCTTSVEANVVYAVMEKTYRPAIPTDRNGNSRNPDSCQWLMRSTFTKRQ